MSEDADKSKTSTSGESKEDLESAINVEEYESIGEACNNIKLQAAATITKWGQALEESEKYDSFYEKRLEDLIKDAEALEKNLKEQKSALKDKLQSLSKTLTMVSENES